MKFEKKKLNLLDKMFKENTGRSLLDSGGAYGRQFEKRQGLNLLDKEYITCTPDERRGLDFEINTFKLLHNQLELDELCNKFNRLKCNDWDCDEFYGISEKQHEWLLNHGFEKRSECINTYNFDNDLDATLQYSLLSNGNDDYILLQIHNGCDVRGGYTDAKLFKLSYNEFLDVTPYIYGNIELNGKITSFDTTRDGFYPAIENESSYIKDIFTIEQLKQAEITLFY